MMKTTEDSTRPYLREKLERLPPGSEKVVAFPTAPPPGSSISLYIKNGNYYGYNSESTNDFGWGCAWRCIQMILCCELQRRHEESRMPTFEQLFLTCGSKTTLLSLYAALHNLSPAEIPASIQTATFAPHDLESGWAEPFIGQLALFHFGLKHQLLAVNSVPFSAHAPAEVFSGNIIEFQDLVKLLTSHFSSPEAGTPVMIDNGTFAYCIIGIGCSAAPDLTYDFWIADPHINPPNEATVAMYWIKLDANGFLRSTSVQESDRCKLYSKGCDRYINFGLDSWMVLL